MKEYKYFNLVKNLKNLSAKNIKHMCVYSKSDNISNILEYLIDEYVPDDS